MSIELVARVLNTFVEPASCKLTLIGLANHANPDGTHVFPSVATLARYVQCDPRTIQRHLRILEAGGWIETVSEAHRYRPNEYLLRGDRLSPLGYVRGDTGDRSGVTPVSGREDIAVSPRPVIEPSVNGQDLKTRQFEEFFTTFPTARKGSRRVVRKAWDKAIKRFPAHHIIVAAGAYRDDPNREDEFTKGAAVWLNNDCWEDGPLPKLNGKPRRAAELPLDRVARELVEEMNGQHPGKGTRNDAARQLPG